ncbi:alpha/beta hydrolase [Pseudoalteromonas sp. OOF1S-7]|uniref:alpha/beta hydrolase n=1 Tax=Pseudoalteromonas sp. OOF1S-7 TaxID=2917757 RepID=UPI001EF52F08|nr:alpha/beta hydrolase [Pseudoalteromonas sp. OOF1S-7]MCG7534357.1 alpha/beta hydrolase [Pseudoalteromonas sp. OOF1S-7]
MKFLKGFGLVAACWLSTAAADVQPASVYDKARDRAIPVEITYPESHTQCSEKAPCPVAFLGAGYGMSHTDYTFLAKVLNKHGYLVVAIGHELPGDPPLSVSGNLFETRSENWLRGAKTLAFLHDELQSTITGYDFNHLTLVGHSNGGDIAAWLGNQGEPYVKQIITLDHRRVPLPKTKAIKVLSIRASDFPADPGVLPSEAEQAEFGSCVVTIPKARHDDIADFGPGWLKDKITLLVHLHLAGDSCPQLQKA